MEILVVSANSSELSRSCYKGSRIKGQDWEVLHLGHLESADEIKKGKLKAYF